jgi:hypothetical protein
MRTIKRTILAAATLCALGTATGARAEINCDDPAQASDYARGFDTRLKDSVARNKANDIARQRTYEEARNQLVNAGAWNEQEANAFMLSVATGSTAGKEMEEKRVKASKEFKVLLYAIDGLAVISGGDQAVERRGVCILGQKTLMQLQVMDEAAGAAWSLVNTNVMKVGKEKGVAGF